MALPVIMHALYLGGIAASSIGAATAFSIAFGDKYKKEKENLYRRWLATTAACNLRKVGDNNFRLYNIEKTTKGIKAITILAPGISLCKLESYKEIIQDNLNCNLEIKKDKFKDYVYLNFIQQHVNIEYKPVRTDFNSYLVGYNPNGKPVLAKFNRDNNIGFFGVTGAGKSYHLAFMLTNIIYNFRDKMDIYLCQIAKGDLAVFKKCPGVKMATTLNKTLEMLEELKSEVNIRSNMFANKGIKNLDHWNKKYGKTSFIKRKLVIIEEYSFFTPDIGDGEEIKALKEKCTAAVLALVKTARSAGIGVWLCAQRSTVGNLSSDIKAQLSKVCFKLKSSIDSENAIGNTEAKRLDPREFIFDSTATQEFLISPEMDDEFRCLQEFVEEIIVPEENKQEEKEKVIEQAKEFENVISEEELKLRRLSFKKTGEASKTLEDLKKQEEKKEVSETNTRDKAILSFIETHGACTLENLHKIFFYKKENPKSSYSSCSRRLKQLGEKGLLKSYIVPESKKKAFYTEKKKSLHDLNCINFYANIKLMGADISKFKLTPYLLNGQLRPDFYIEFKWQGKVYKIYGENDYTHYTSQFKIGLYESLQKEFKLLIGKDTDLKIKSDKLDIIHVDTEFTKFIKVFN